MLHEALTTTAVVLFYAMGGLGMTWRLASSLCELFHFTADNEYVVSLVSINPSISLPKFNHHAALIS